MNKRKTKKMKRRGGASLRSPQSPQSRTKSESDKLEPLKSVNLHKTIGGIKKKLDALNNELSGFPDYGQILVDAKVKYDKSTITPPSNVEKMNRDYEDPLIFLNKKRELYKDKALKSAKLVQSISKSVHELISYKI